jgi:hypothetical protein
MYHLQPSYLLVDRAPIFISQMWQFSYRVLLLHAYAVVVTEVLQRPAHPAQLRSGGSGEVGPLTLASTVKNMMAPGCKKYRLVFL